MVPIAAIAWYRSPLPLFQTFSVIILEPVSKNFLEAPLKLITAVLQLLTFSEYHTRANDSELTMSSIAILPLLMNLLSHQLRDTVCCILGVGKVVSFFNSSAAPYGAILEVNTTFLIFHFSAKATTFSAPRIFVSKYS